MKQIKVDRKSPIPLYVQVATKIKEIIAKTGYKKNQRFLSERELSQVFKVNRVTIRRAMALLSDEKIIYQDKGIGTFVKKIPVVTETKPKLFSIGFLVYNDDPHHPFCTRLYAGIQREAELNDIGLSFGDSDNIDDAIRWILERDLKGVIITGKVTDDIVREIRRTRICLLVIGNLALKEKVNFIGVLAIEAVEQSVSELIERGCRDIGLICGSRSRQLDRELGEGVKRSLQKHGLQFKEEYFRFNEKGNYEQEMVALVGLPKPPDAVVLVQDAFWKVARYIFENKHLGIKVPLIVKYGDDPLLSEYEDLVSIFIRINNERLGETGFRKLVSLIKGACSSPIQERYPLEICITRNSASSYARTEGLYRKG